MHQTVKVLNRHYHFILLSLIVLLLMAMFRIFSFENLFTSNVIAERYAIGVTLIVIPLVLKRFSDQTKKISQNKSQSEMFKQYKSIFFQRLYPLSFVALGNIILYAVSQNMNFMWLSVITLLAFAFCKASAHELKGMIHEEEKEEVITAEEEPTNQND